MKELIAGKFEDKDPWRWHNKMVLRECNLQREHCMYSTTPLHSERHTKLLISLNLRKPRKVNRHKLSPLMDPQGKR